MVKNTQGGSGHKKFGRKFTSASSKSNKLRVSEDEGELYAIATKMLGNNMFHCLCMDGVVRLGHIRGKFTGRGKRDNMVQGGKWILVGLREWDTQSLEKSMVQTSAKMQQCDLMEVYTDFDKQRLRDTISADWSLLDKNDVSRTATIDRKNDGDDWFEFGTEKDFERERLVEEMKSATAEKITLKTVEEEEAEINIDDI